MSAVFSRTLVYFNSYPLLRGVATYAIIWPVSNLCQQAITGKEEFDFVEALRYSLFGAFYVAPSLHGWLKLSGTMWPQMNVKTALKKVTVYLIFISLSFS
jgi:protein Mpv17